MIKEKKKVLSTQIVTKIHVNTHICAHILEMCGNVDTHVKLVNHAESMMKKLMIVKTAIKPLVVIIYAPDVGELVAFVGLFVGVPVGASDGVFVGLRVGFLVGKRVGEFD